MKRYGEIRPSWDLIEKVSNHTPALRCRGVYERNFLRRPVGQIPLTRLSDNPGNPSPSMGEGKALQRRVKVGVEKIANIPRLTCLPLPFIPPTRGGETSCRTGSQRGF
jgi:hypothetical protein